MCHCTNCQCQNNTLGLVASGARSIRSGKEYNRFFNLGGLERTDPIIGKGDAHETLRQMEKLVKAYQYQTKALASHLKKSNLRDTLKVLFDFMYNHIQYRTDKDGVEQLRTPLRTWKDRKEGVDCDCYTIFASSVLTNLGIPHAFRMAKYDDDWQHVYVVVPKDGKAESLNQSGGYYTVDPVTDQFDHEVEYSQKYDKIMSTKLQTLNGFGSRDPQAACRPIQDRTVHYTSLKSVENQGYVATEKLLLQNQIPYTKLRNSETNEGSLAIQTRNGTLKQVPTVVTQDQAEEIIITMADSPNRTNGDVIDITYQEAQPEDHAGNGNEIENILKKMPWVPILIIGAGLLLTTSGGVGLSGPPMSGGSKSSKRKPRGGKRTQAKAKKPVVINL